MSDLPPGFILDKPTGGDLPPGFVVDKPGMIEDAAKSVGSGLSNATIGTFGAAGDLRSALSSLVDRAGQKFGFDPETVKTAAGYGAKMLGPVGQVMANAPTSEDIRNSATDPIVSPDYKPQTVLGGYLKTGAEFAPGMATGEGGLLTRALTQVVAPTVISETLGKLTEGSRAEPYARAIGGLLGSAGATKAVNSLMESRALKAATPTMEAIKDTASNTYDTLTNRNIAIPISQSTLDNLANDITKTLNNKGIRPSTAEAIHRAVDEIRTPANQLNSGMYPGNPAYAKGLPDVADLVAARENVKGLLGAQGPDKAGAAIALDKINRAIEQQSPTTTARISEADKNWAAYKANQALDKRLARADLRAAGEHSGMNVGNRIRQQVTNYLVSNESRFLSPENRAELEKIVKGTATQNAIRQVSNLLGGGGGLGMLMGATIGGTAGYSAHGDPLEGALAGLAMGAAGRGLKIANNRAVIRSAEKAAEAIRRRSPLGQQALSPTMPSPILPGVTLPNPSYIPLPKKMGIARNSISALIPAILARQ